MVCKYFSGVYDGRFGDLQSRAPAGGRALVKSPAPAGCGMYAVSYKNGFMNISFDDGFILNYAARAAVRAFEEHLYDAPVCEPAPCAQGAHGGPGTPGAPDHFYKKYVLSNYIHDIWGLEASYGAALSQAGGRGAGRPFSCFEQRWLFVMAVFLCEIIKNRPYDHGQFMKLCAILTDGIYAYITARSAAGADASDILLTSMFNIPAFRGA